MNNRNINVRKEHCITYNINGDIHNSLVIKDCLDNYNFITIEMDKEVAIHLPKDILKTIQEVLYQYEQ